MRMILALGIAFFGPTVVNAARGWECSCYHPEDPKTSFANHLCANDPSRFCYDPRRNINSCILDDFVTNPMCGHAYQILNADNVLVDDPYIIAQCRPSQNGNCR
ncbi:hypothetical protein PTNB73_01381 [Pyrenophora teres f. teres]|nr:hypothetical protein PTNB73_01381 [Pyrenophora teres f. teres]